MKITFINGQFYVAGGVEQGQQISRTLSAGFFQFNVDDIAVCIVDFGNTPISGTDFEFAAFPIGLKQAFLNIGYNITVVVDIDNTEGIPQE